MVAATSSWIEIPEDSDFSLDNIPFGVARRQSDNGKKSACFCATAIGDTVVNLQILQEAGLFDAVQGLHPTTFYQDTLNVFIEHPAPVWKDVRSTLIALFSMEGSALHNNAQLQQAAFLTRQDVQMVMPIQVKEYTDFYSSREHATNVGVSPRTIISIEKSDKASQLSHIVYFHLYLLLLFRLCFEVKTMPCNPIGFTCQ
jgi:fumarylacetoacetase